MNFKSIRSHMLHALVLINFTGQPYIQLKEEKIVPVLKQNLSFKSDTYVRTNPHDFVHLKINDHFQITVLPDSVLTLDGVHRKDQFVIHTVFLHRGRISLQNKDLNPKTLNQSLSILKSIDTTSSDVTKVQTDDMKLSDNDEDRLKIESDFFSFNLDKHQKNSLLIEVNMKEPSVNLCNFNESYQFKLFDHEVIQDLKLNEGVEFKGVLNSAGQLAFDYLLEKRKIPKGKWSPKKLCSIEQVKLVEDQVAQFYSQEKKDLEKKRLKKVLEKKRRDSIYLCHEPYGQLDQCHFILKQNKCIRSRCNAEGKWTDQTDLSASKNLCSSAGEVKACGY